MSQLSQFNAHALRISQSADALRDLASLGLFMAVLVAALTFLGIAGGSV